MTIKKANSPGPKITEKSTKPCCMGSSDCATPAKAAAKGSADAPFAPTSAESRKGGKTKIVVKYDVGFNNSLFLRGKGASLSWEKGIPLKNIRPDEWVWETEAPFSTCEFKVLINDKQYETGENHRLTSGTQMQYTPQF